MRSTVTVRTLASVRRRAEPVQALLGAHRYATVLGVAFRVPLTAVPYRPVLDHVLLLVDRFVFDLVFGAARGEVQAPHVLPYLVRLLFRNGHRYCVSGRRKMEIKSPLHDRLQNIL